MNVLFDQNVPYDLKRHLGAHEVTTAPDVSWEEIKNGELLAIAESRGFDVFVTAEKNLSYQQNLTARRIAIVLLPTNSWPKLRPFVHEFAALVDAAVPGSLTKLAVPMSALRRTRRPQ